jgi:hypothetical protein
VIRGLRVEASLCSRFSSPLVRCRDPSPLYHFHAKQRRQRSNSVLKYIHRPYARFMYHQFTYLSSLPYYFFVPTDFFSFYTVHLTKIKSHISTFHPFPAPSVFTSLFIPLLLSIPTDILPFDTVYFTNISDLLFYSMYLVRLSPILISLFQVYHSYQVYLLPINVYFLDLGFFLCA